MPTTQEAKSRSPSPTPLQSYFRVFRQGLAPTALSLQIAKKRTPLFHRVSSYCITKKWDCQYIMKIFAGELLKKDAFEGELLKKFPLTPSKLSHNKYRNQFVSFRTDGRRERTARFCCRERLGTSKTLSAKRVE